MWSVASPTHQILPLPPEVQAQITSSIAITSLSDVVIELVKNSLDAQARAVYVDVDHLRGGCIVEDDGHGIPAAELAEDGHLGSMYCTSKLNPPTPEYGSHGRFISSLSALSLLSITSRYQAEADEYTVTLHQSRVLARVRTSEKQQRVLQKTHGTKVAVHDLFGKLPVRVKHRAIQYELQENLEREFEGLKRKTVAVLLACSRPVKVILSDAHKRRCVLRLDPESLLHGPWDSENAVITKLPFQLDWICALLAQAGYIAHSSYASWVTASARTSTTSIRAAISLEPAPTKQVQFFSFGIRPVDPVYGNRVLFDEVNRMFALSTFGAIEYESETSEDDKSRRPKDKRYKSGDCTTRQPRSMSKGADKWPMFYIRIESSSELQLADECQPQNPAGEATRILQKVLQLLQNLIYEFLEEHHFQPRARRVKRRKEGNGFAHTQTCFSGPIMHPLLNEASSQSTQVIASTACAPSDDKGSKLRRCVTGRAFDAWSMVKSGKQDGFEHILSGVRPSKSLPDDHRPATAPATSSYCQNSRVDIGLRALAGPQAQTSLGGDVQLLLQELRDEDLVADADDEKARNESRRSITSVIDTTTATEDEVPPHNPPTDETMLWTNPTTDKAVHINSRTGLIVPSSLEHDSHHEKSEEDYSTRSNSEPGLVSRCVRSVRPIRKRLEPRMHVAPDSWIHDLFKGSENPVFRQLEDAIPSVAPETPITSHSVASYCHSKFDNEIGKQVSALFDTTTETCRRRLSKSDLASAQVLAQVDRKFILVKVNTGQTCARINATNGQPLSEETLLVVIDQHAADERCQIEALYEGLCFMETIQLPKPIYFEVPAREIPLFQLQKEFFGDWGFRYYTQTGHAHDAPGLALRTQQHRPAGRKSEDSYRIIVTALPGLVAERCRLDPKILIDFLRNEIWARVEDGSVNGKLRISPNGCDSAQSDPEASNEDEKRWLSKISRCPQGLIEMLNSRACRSAIMFNDVLSVGECQALVKRLSKCSFPFQCAHGRPSMVALGGFTTADVGHDPPSTTGTLQMDAEGEGDFVEAFDKWQGNLGGA